MTENRPSELLLHRLKASVQHFGWVLMGYPANTPGWKPVYRLGARLHNWRNTPHSCPRAKA